MSDAIIRPPMVRHYVAGGTENGGGIGRLVGYVRSSPDTCFRHEVVDTRGPRWDPLRSPVYLLHAMAVVSTDGLRSVPVLHHLHVAGRGSTARKLVIASVCRALGAPYVLHLHDYDYAADLARRPAWQFGAVKALFQGARHVVVLGQRDLRTVTSILEVPATRVTLLRNCVPVPSPMDVPRQDDVTILFLGRLGPRKGVPELLAAFAHPAMPRRGWRAILAGDVEVDVYRGEVARLGLAGRVRLTGWVDAGTAARLRAEADILALPSHAEGFAMAVLEGLAQGIAVVTTPVGAHGEALSHGRDCLFVPPGDVPALATALARLVREPALREGLGAAGQRLFRSEFSMNVYVAALEALQSAQLGAGAPSSSSA